MKESVSKNILCSSIVAANEAKTFFLTPSFDGSKLTGCQIWGRSSSLDCDFCRTSTSVSWFKAIRDNIANVELSGIGNLLHMDENAMAEVSCLSVTAVA